MNYLEPSSDGSSFQSFNNGRLETRRSPLKKYRDILRTLKLVENEVRKRMGAVSPVNNQGPLNLRGLAISTAHFPLASLCIEDAEHFMGESFAKQHSRDDIIQAMENVALSIELGDTLTLAWEMVKEELSR